MAESGAETVGAFSLRILKSAQEQGQLTFQGDEDGIETINGLTNDTQVISKTEIKAYGWCFSLNTVVPQTMADETPLTEADDVIWYYGYAHYLNGDWIPGCTPAWK